MVVGLHDGGVGVGRMTWKLNFSSIGTVDHEFEAVDVSQMECYVR